MVIKIGEHGRYNVPNAFCKTCNGSENFCGGSVVLGFNVLSSAILAQALLRSKRRRRLYGVARPQRRGTINLPACSFTRKDYEFLGWSTTRYGGVEYVDGASFTMGGPPA